MNADTLEVFDRCVRAWVTLARRGDKLHAEALDPQRLPPDLFADLAEHKADLLALLDHMAEADVLLLESTRTLADRWPSGCELDGEWDRLEADVHTAYWSRDLDRLRAALADRDAHALSFFDTYRMEVSQ